MLTIHALGWLMEFLFHLIISRTRASSVVAAHSPYYHDYHVLEMSKIYKESKFRLHTNKANVFKDSYVYDKHPD